MVFADSDSTQRDVDAEVSAAAIDASPSPGTCAAVRRAAGDEQARQPVASRAP